MCYTCYLVNAWWVFLYVIERFDWILVVFLIRTCRLLNGLRKIICNWFLCSHVFLKYALAHRLSSLVFTILKCFFLPLSSKHQGRVSFSIPEVIQWTLRNQSPITEFPIRLFVSRVKLWVNNSFSGTPGGTLLLKIQASIWAANLLLGARQLWIPVCSFHP